MGLRSALAGIVLLSVALLVGVQAQTERPIAVTLGLDQEFYYAGDSLMVQVSVRNNGKDKQNNPLRTPLLAGFKVRAPGGEPLPAVVDHGLPEPSRPKELEGGAFYGTVLDLTKLHSQLSAPGVYEIYWGADGLVSNMLVVTIIERYDPSADYSAEIETGSGTFIVDLNEDRAPIATQSFVDMARTGVFDGMTIHEAHRDDFIVGGDPLFTPGPPRRTVQYPAELAPLPVVAGSVVLKPINPAPMTNGSIFMVLLRPHPEWTGQVTVLGQVTKGLDAVRSISQVPTTARDSKPFFKPLEEVVIRKVKILEKRPAEGAPS